MTRGRSVGGAEMTGAEMTGAEVTGAEVTGAEMVWGRSVLGPRWFGAEVSVNRVFAYRQVRHLKVCQQFDILIKFQYAFAY